MELILPAGWVWRGLGWGGFRVEHRETQHMTAVRRGTWENSPWTLIDWCV